MCICVWGENQRSPCCSGWCQPRPLAMVWGGCGVTGELVALCSGSFISHTEKVPWFLRKGRGRVLVWAGAIQGATGGPVSGSGQGRGQGHLTVLLATGWSKEGPEESWDLPVPWSPSGTIWQRLCTGMLSGARWDRSERRPLQSQQCPYGRTRPCSHAWERCGVFCFPRHCLGHAAGNQCNSTGSAGAGSSRFICLCLILPMDSPFLRLPSHAASSDSHSPPRASGVCGHPWVLRCPSSSPLRWLSRLLLEIPSVPDSCCNLL